MRTRRISLLFRAAALALFAAAVGFGFQDALQQPPENGGRDPRSTYVLGRDDVITIRVTDAEEIGDQPVRIDPNGYIDLPMAGRLRAAGLTMEQLKAALVSRLKTYLNQPEVTVSIAEVHSQPVSVIGAVNTPGVIQLQGNKTLFEILA